jgi:hypothetical protein
VESGGESGGGGGGCYVEVEVKEAILKLSGIRKQEGYVGLLCRQQEYETITW